MDALTTYEFYTDTYYGDTITDETAFSKWLDRATDKLLLFTGTNLTDATLDIYKTQVQKAVCAVADLLYEIDIATKAATAKDDSNIKSKSSGNESVTFGDQDTLVTKVLSDKKAQRRLIYDVLLEYLAGTGLLYAGR